MSNLKKIPIWLVLSFFVSLLTLVPFAKSGLPMAHDSLIQVQKNQQFAKALSEGQFPVRLAPDFGYQVGYPIFDFMYPLPMYIGTALNFFGISFSDGVKIIIILSMVLSSVGMYLLASKFWGPIGGFVSATLYILAPYHAVDLYVRGSTGELVAMAIAPFIFYFSLRFLENKRKSDWLSCTLLVSLLILSHNITALIFFPLIIIFILVYSFVARDLKFLLSMMLSVVAGVLITSYFWFPALYDKQFVVADEIFTKSFNYTDHFVYPVQLFLYSPWGFGGSQPGPIDGMSFKLEKQFLIVYVLSAISLFVLIFKKQKKAHTSLIFLAVGLLAGFLTLTISQSIWKSLPLIYLVQFPWRFLTLLIFCFGLITGSIIQVIKNKELQIFTAVLITLGILITSSHLFKPGPGEYQNDEMLLNRVYLESTTTTKADEFRPKWIVVPQNTSPEKMIETSNNNDSVSSLEFKSNLVRFDFQSQNPTTIKVNKYYYPGWKVYINGKEYNFDPLKSEGFIEFPVDQGQHIIEIRFSETLPRLVADYISLSFFVLSLLVVLILRNKQWKRLVN